ncbi:MAG: UDP-glucose 4-epimerase GalE [Alphaproteobacteria bacterium]
MAGTVLITGGAGYIGSHVLCLLAESGYDVVAYDNLSTGRPEAVLAGELVVGDLADTAVVEKLLSSRRFDSVLHFAASISVPESIADPAAYYANNTANTLGLLRCCIDARVANFVFSSTAAVYGEPESGIASESSRLVPINPYGRSKLMSEWILADMAAASDLRYVVLRYFNAAGADSKGRIGQSYPGATHLIKVACEAATGKRGSVTVFGTDYPTPDGTGIRDYIHVEDLAAAHLDALRHLERGGESCTLNCGYGRGFSVREVLECVKACSGVDFAVVEGPRRAGDPARLVADSARIRDVLGWAPRHDRLEEIVRSALQWERKLSEPSERRHEAR